MFVIGTAGHVDHGKSSLVEALSGIDPDRLREEKEREMTIDLGFAWLTLPNGIDVGIIDVPGHRDFIENMLAGVGGIDLALFVVAADEGVMPQTVEHLAILDLLEIRGGVIALTKVDMVDDPDWLELVTLDVTESFSGTVLADAPVVPVSSKTGLGLSELLDTIGSQLGQMEPKPDLGRPRLPIDRVFSLPGFGTIVTGTLSGGHLKIGDSVEISPGARQARIRGLQTHRTKLEKANPGSRVAVNLTGLHKDEIQRGDLLTAPGAATTTLLCDVKYRHLSTAGMPLKHNTEVKLFVGSAEVIARTRVLKAKQVDPGEEGWLQLALDEPVAMIKGDRFIIRQPSPPQTLGGGLILDPKPGRKHRRYRTDVEQRLELLHKGTPEEILLEGLFRFQPAKLRQVKPNLELSDSEFESAYQELLAAKRLDLLGDFVLPEGALAVWQEKLETLLEQYHRESPLRPGMPREELRSRLGVEPEFFNTLLSWSVEKGAVELSGTSVRLRDFEIRFNVEQKKAVENLMNQLNAAGINTPSVKECKSAVGEDVYYALIDLNELIQVNDDVVYTSKAYEDYVGQIVDYLRNNGVIDAAKLRDMLNTSRKYAIALLEHLDDIRVTRRVGDHRELVG